MRAISLASLLLAGCNGILGGSGGGGGPGAGAGNSSPYGPRGLSHPAAAAFQEWQDTILRRDFDAYYAMTTAERRCHLLMEGFRGDLERGVIPGVEMLDRDEIEVVRVWWQINRAEPVPSILPEGMVRGRWLAQVLRNLFAGEADRLASDYAGATATQVVVESETVASVLVLTRTGDRVSVQFRRVGDAWLCDVVLDPRH